MIRQSKTRYVINIRSFFLQKRDRIIFLSVTIVFLTLGMPMIHGWHVLNETTTDLSQYEEKRRMFFVEYSLKTLAYLLLLGMYSRFHNIMNRFFRSILLSQRRNNNISQDNNNEEGMNHIDTAKTNHTTAEETWGPPQPTLPPFQRHDVHLLLSEVSRGVLSTVWVMTVHVMLGKYSPCYLWLLVYACLGSVAIEMSSLAEGPDQNGNSANLENGKSTQIQTNSSYHTVTYTTIALMVCGDVYVMYMLNCSLFYCISSMVAVMIMQVMTIELIDFLKNHSIQFVQEREMESMKYMAKLYKKLYMSAPDTFLAVTLTKPFTALSSSDSIVNQFQIVQCNSAACDMLGYEHDVLCDMSLNKLILHPSAECNYEAALGRSDITLHEMQTKAVSELESILSDFHTDCKKKNKCYDKIVPIFVTDKKGKIMTCSLSISKVQLWDSSRVYHDMTYPFYYNIIIHNLTQKYLLMDELNIEKEKAIQANKAKSQFLTQMSHELRTPLHGIIGLTDILALNIPENSPDSEIVSTIKYSGNILLGLINDLLDICKIESSNIRLEPRKFDLLKAVNEISKGIFQPQANLKGLKFNLIVSHNVPSVVIGDESRVIQIIINLVYNAIKFTEKGSVTLLVDKQPLENDPTTECISFTVNDTGIGIQSEQISKLFQPFSQLHTAEFLKNNRVCEGTGLGLYISKQLVEMMGGELGVTSEPGVGSSFYFNVKLKSCEKNEEEISPTTSISSPCVSSNSIPFAVRENPYENLRVLIVEDNAINRVVLVNMLKKVGFRYIDTANDGAEGVERFTSIQKSDSWYDIAFIDIYMPKLNGFDVVKAILELESHGTHHAALVALTANGFEETRNTCLSSGFDVFMSKPFSMNDFKNCLEECRKIPTKPILP